MKLIRISPKFQITIPKMCRHLCRTGWFSLTLQDNVITLKSIEISESKTEKENMKELLKSSGVESENLSGFME